MDFTREPIIETVITPKEGYKLLLKSSKFESQDEYMLDAVEVVTFGHSSFYRCREKPKAFIVPLADFELVEVREARLVLKTMGTEKPIKIAGGREPARPKEVERQEPSEKVEEEVGSSQPQEARADGRNDRKRDRRRQGRKRRGRDEGTALGGPQESETSEEPLSEAEEANRAVPKPFALIAPPTTLISETLAKYRDDELFKGAFYSKEEGMETETSVQVQSSGSDEFDESDRALFQAENPPREFRGERQEEPFFPIEQEPQGMDQPVDETDWVNDSQPIDEK